MAARTPLLRHLVRALRLAHVSDESGVPPRELVERSREAARLHRRTVLQGAGALALGAALEGCARNVRPVVREGDRVLVVGAGLAGLTAAWRLRQAGVDVELHEASARAGGRVYSLRHHFADAQVAELGGELIDTSHVHVQQLARELGLVLDDLYEDPRGLAGDLWFFEGERRTDEALVEAFLPVAARIRGDLAPLGEAPDVSFRSAEAARALDRVSLAEWLHGLEAPGWVRRLLEVGYVAEYGLEADRQSALNLLMMVGVEAPPFRLYGESDERFHVRGGNDALARALAGRLSDALTFGSRLESVRPVSDGALEVTLRQGASSVVRRAARVVLALPFTLLREVELALPLPPEKALALRELQYGTNAKLMLGFSERVWRTRHASSGSSLSDTGLQSTWETSRAQPGRAGLLTNFVGGRAGDALGLGTPEVQGQRAVALLERLYPGAARAHAGQPLARFHWPSHPLTRGSYACYGPGDWTRFGGAEGEAVGALHFCGEHTSRVSQGFMDGAVESGERVAGEVLAALGVRVAF